VTAAEPTQPTPAPPPANPPGAAWLVALSAIIGAGLAYVIGWRLETNTLAVILGVATGVAASVPTALLLLVILRRANRANSPPHPPEPPPPPTWDPAPRPNVLMLDLDALIQRRVAQTPIPPQYLQLGQPDADTPSRVVGREEWT